MGLSSHLRQDHSRSTALSQRKKESLSSRTSGVEEDMSTPRGESERLGREQDFLLPSNGMLIILIWTSTDGTPEGWKTCGISRTL